MEDVISVTVYKQFGNLTGEVKNRREDMFDPKNAAETFAVSASGVTSRSNSVSAGGGGGVVRSRLPSSTSNSQQPQTTSRSDSRKSTDSTTTKTGVEEFHGSGNNSDDAYLR